jgi:hypothetical protein
MISSGRHWRSVVAGMCALFVVLVSVGVVVWSLRDSAQSNTTTTTTISPTSPSGPLSAPQTTATEDAQYLADLTEVDHSLAAYEKASGNVALRSLLTVGSAFCAFLQRDSGIDEAMMDVAVGARSEESQTKLPMSVRSLNSIEAVALLTLCPSLQAKLSTSDLNKIRELGAALPTPAS